MSDSPVMRFKRLKTSDGFKKRKWYHLNRVTILAKNKAKNSKKGIIHISKSNPNTDIDQLIQQKKQKQNHQQQQKHGLKSSITRLNIIYQQIFDPKPLTNPTREN